MRVTLEGVGTPPAAREGVRLLRRLGRELMAWGRQWREYQTHQTRQTQESRGAT